MLPNTIATPWYKALARYPQRPTVLVLGSSAGASLLSNSPLLCLAYTGQAESSGATRGARTVQSDNYNYKYSYNYNHHYNYNYNYDYSDKPRRPPRRHAVRLSAKRVTVYFLAK